MILVVGGTGTLGRELVPRLLAQGQSVRVLTRDETRARGMPEAATLAIGDLRDPASISRALDGCHAVVAAAHGFVGPGNPNPEAVDRDGNGTLIRASAALGVSHFVLVSVHGASAHHPLSLARAKYAAEQQLRASRVPFTIVRSTPLMETWRNILSGMLDEKGHALVFGPGTNPINFVSARDVAAAIAQAIDAGSPANETLELCGPDNLGLVAVARQVIEARGQAARTKHVPLAALRVLSVLARFIAPSFARQAQAAVLMNTTDMAVSPEVAAQGRSPGVPTTSFTQVLAHALPLSLPRHGVPSR